MKKIYLKPTTELVKVAQQLMATGSLNVNGDGGTGTVYDEELEDGDKVLSRRNRNAWEDEEYDDEEDF